MENERKESFEALDLEDNNIFFLNMLKKLRAFYREEEYKNKEDNDPDKVITIALKKLKKLSKLNERFDNVILPELEKYEIIRENGKKYNIFIENIDLYFSEVDTKKIEKAFLLMGNWVTSETAQKIIDTKELSFNDKVQRIFTNLESVKDNQNILKDLIDEKLRESKEFLEASLELEETKNTINILKDELIPEEMVDSMDKLKREWKDEKEILMEFLEFSAENGKINEIEVLNKKWIKFKPKMSFSLKKVKNKNKIK